MLMSQRVRSARFFLSCDMQYAHSNTRTRIRILHLPQKIGGTQRLGAHFEINERTSLFIQE